MYLPNPFPFEHAEESASVRKVSAHRMNHDGSYDLPLVSRKVSIANSTDKMSSEGSGMFFVRSFTREELSYSDSDSQSSRDSSTTRVQARRRRNLIRHRIGSLGCMENNFCGKRFQTGQRGQLTNLEGMGLCLKRDDIHDDHSFSSLSNGIHDDDDESFDSCDECTQNAYCCSFESGTLLNFS
jgi:hypothetical protein